MNEMSISHVVEVVSQPIFQGIPEGSHLQTQWGASGVDSCALLQLSKSVGRACHHHHQSDSSLCQ